MKTKTCFRCGRTLPITEFYAHKAMADGHLNKCKDCTKGDVRRRRIEHPKADLETRLKACEKRPTKKNAYMALDAAIRAGEVTRRTVCSGCGCPEEVTHLRGQLGKLQADNAKLRELVRDMWRFTGAACKKYPKLFDPAAQGGQMVQPNAIDAFEQRMRELGVDE